MLLFFLDAHTRLPSRCQIIFRVVEGSEGDGTRLRLLPATGRTTRLKVALIDRARARLHLTFTSSRAFEGHLAIPATCWSGFCFGFVVF